MQDDASPCAVARGQKALAFLGSTVRRMYRSENFLVIIEWSDKITRRSIFENSTTTIIIMSSKKEAAGEINHTVLQGDLPSSPRLRSSSAGVTIFCCGRPKARRYRKNPLCFRLCIGDALNFLIPMGATTVCGTMPKVCIISMSKRKL